MWLHNKRRYINLQLRMSRKRFEKIIMRMIKTVCHKMIIIKRGASDQWSFKSLYCLMRNSVQMTIGKMHPTLPYFLVNAVTTFVGCVTVLGKIMVPNIMNVRNIKKTKLLVMFRKRLLSHVIAHPIGPSTSESAQRPYSSSLLVVFPSRSAEPCFNQPEKDWFKSFII